MLALEQKCDEIQLQMISFAVCFGVKGRIKALTASSTFSEVKMASVRKSTVPSLNLYSEYEAHLLDLSSNSWSVNGSQGALLHKNILSIISYRS